MALPILNIIAVWMLCNQGLLPTALAILVTIFGSLTALVKLIKGISTIVQAAK